MTAGKENAYISNPKQKMGPDIISVLKNRGKFEASFGYTNHAKSKIRDTKSNDINQAQRHYV